MNAPPVVLEHYSGAPPGPLVERQQGRALYATGIGKPTGLWVSVPGTDDWPTWCRANKFALERLAWVTKFRIAEGARILWLGSSRELDDFDSAFGRQSRFPDERVDWAAVARDYQGIVIAPYQWGRRLTGGASAWYYGWDCASGCIWDPAALVVHEAAALAPPIQHEAVRA